MKLKKWHEMTAKGKVLRVALILGIAFYILLLIASISGGVFLGFFAFTVITSLLIFLIVYLIKYTIKTAKAQKEKEAQFGRPLQSTDKIEYQRLQEIITESQDIIAKSKNIATIESRFDVVINYLCDWFDRYHGYNSPYYFFAMVVKNKNDALALNDAKAIFIDTFCFKQIQDEIDTAELLTDEKLKKAQYKKILTKVLKLKEHIADIERLKLCIAEIEKKVTV